MSFQNLNLARKMIRNLFEEGLKKELDGHTSLSTKPELKGLKWWIDTPKTEFSDDGASFKLTVGVINESLDKVSPLNEIDEISATFDQHIENIWNQNKYAFDLKKLDVESNVDGRHGIVRMVYEVEVWL